MQPANAPARTPTAPPAPAGPLQDLTALIADLRDATLKALVALKHSAEPGQDDEDKLRAAHVELDTAALKLHLAHAFVASLAHARAQQVKARSPHRGKPASPAAPNAC